MIIAVRQCDFAGRSLSSRGRWIYLVHEGNAVNVVSMGDTRVDFDDRVESALLRNCRPSDKGSTLNLPIPGDRSTRNRNHLLKPKSDTHIPHASSFYKKHSAEEKPRRRNVSATHCSLVEVRWKATSRKLHAGSSITTMGYVWKSLALMLFGRLLFWLGLNVP